MLDREKRPFPVGRRTGAILCGIIKLSEITIPAMRKTQWMWGSWIGRESEERFNWVQKYFNYAPCGLIEIDENYYTEFVRIVWNANTLIPIWNFAGRMMIHCRNADVGEDPRRYINILLYCTTIMHVCTDPFIADLAPGEEIKPYMQNLFHWSPDCRE